MNISANLKLFFKFFVHTALIILFVAIFIFSKTNFDLHTKLPFVFLAVWLAHLYLNKQYLISFFNGKIKGREALYKVIMSILLFLAIILTIIFGSTILNGQFVPLINDDIAYNYHGTLANLCVFLILLHLFQNKRGLKFVWKKLFGKNY